MFTRDLRDSRGALNYGELSGEFEFTVCFANNLESSPESCFMPNHVYELRKVSASEAIVSKNESGLHAQYSALHRMIKRIRGLKSRIYVKLGD